VAAETDSVASLRRLGWLDPTLVGFCAVSVALTVLAGLVQVRFGTFPMSFATAWAAVFDPAVWLRPDVLAKQAELLVDFLVHTHHEVELEFANGLPDGDFGFALPAGEDDFITLHPEIEFCPHVRVSIPPGFD